MANNHIEKPDTSTATDLCPHCNQSHLDETDFCPKTGRPLTDIATRMIGRTIADKYKLIRCIGQGGMGTIFEAEHLMIGNRVAVKLLHESQGSVSEPVQRLYREARATGAIGHPNIIQVFDVGETEEGTPFLVLELLEGDSLGHLIETDGPLPLDFVLEVGVQLLSALQAAHSAGIIHRDLKSDNIFVLRDNEGDQRQIKILDFGVSKFVTKGAEDLKLTQTGSIVGTPHYMSPEQAFGQKDLDHRLDIYAAGIILYEALIGEVPHEATNYNALLVDIITTEIKSLRSQRKDIPEQLEKILLKALAKDREDRWPSAQDFLEAITTIRDTPSSPVPNIQNEAPGDSEAVGGSDTPRPRPQSRNSKNWNTTLDIDYENPDFPSIDPGRGRSRRVFIRGAVVTGFLVFLGLAYFFSFGNFSPFLQNQNGEQPDDEAGSTIPAKSDFSNVSLPVNKSDGAAKPVFIKIQRDPAHTRIRIGDRTIPVEGISLPQSLTPIEITGDADGYITKKFKITPDQDIDIEMELAPVEPEPKEKTNHRKRKPKKNSRPSKSGDSEIEKESSDQKDSLKPKPDSIDQLMDNPF